MAIVTIESKQKVCYRYVLDKTQVVTRVWQSKFQSPVIMNHFLFLDLLHVDSFLFDRVSVFFLSHFTKREGFLFEDNNTQVNDAPFFVFIFFFIHNFCTVLIYMSFPFVILNDLLHGYYLQLIFGTIVNISFFHPTILQTESLIYTIFCLKLGWREKFLILVAILSFSCLC